jgi:pimeloyl-ACP methyl ester carboxylesterase
MPQVEVDRLTINYELQGEGEPLLLIHYTSADHASWAFQLPAYTEQFSCIAPDLPGAGESDKPPGPYSTNGQADQVAAFLGAVGIERAHVAGMSFGAAVGIYLAARHPRRVRSLSLHSGWHATDDYLKIVIEQWHACVHAADRRRRSSRGHLSVVLHARDVRRAAGVRRHAGGVRA